MRTLVKTKDMSREEWLRWRSKGLGGSDCSIIAGVNPYKSIYELWLEKTGQIELMEEDNEILHFGNVMEPIIKKEFTARTGIKVRAKHMMLQSDEYPFMLADLDGVINEDGEMVIFEAKTASAYKKEVWEKGVPLEYVYQVQHYMAVTGAKKAYVAAIVGGNQFIYHEVLRDELLISQIIRMEQKFWEENVLGGVPPRADGSKATTAYLNETYAKSNGSSIELPVETLDLFRRYDELSMQIDKLTASKDEVTNQLKSYLMENESGFIADRRISWKTVNRTDFDRKRLEQEQPEVYEEYLKQSSYRRLSVA